MNRMRPTIIILGVFVCTANADAQNGGNRNDRGPTSSQLATDYRKGAGVSIGQVVPPLAIKEFVGTRPSQELTWQSLEGYVVVLEFWATWCIPCVERIPHLNTLAEAYHDKGVRFLSISDEPRNIIERFLRVRPISGWVALDPDRSMFDAYCRGTSIPQTFVVNGRGLLVAGPLMPNELTTDVLDAVLAGKELPLLPSPSPESAVSDFPRSTPPPSPLDEKAMLQIAIGPPLSSQYMEWSSGTYVNSAVDVETLLTVVLNLRTPLLIRWETPKPIEHVSFMAKMPDHRDDLLAEMGLNALEACLGLTVRHEKMESDVFVISAPEGPGPNLISGSQAEGTHHRFHRVSAEGLLFTTDGNFAGLLEDLEGVLGRPIVNETGFQGRWSWGLQFKAGDIESVQRSAREQLGLLLTPERRTIDMVVVRKASRPGEQQ